MGCDTTTTGVAAAAAADSCAAAGNDDCGDGDDVVVTAGCYQHVIVIAVIPLTHTLVLLHTAAHGSHLYTINREG